MNTTHQPEEIPEEQSKKETYEQKQAKKEAARVKEERRRAWKRRIRRALFLLFFLGAAAALFALFSQPQEDLADDQSRAMPLEGDRHVAEGQDVEYESNPPTSGFHWPVPLKDGVYSEEKPDEAIVHSLEHGRVWISYKPSIPQEAKEELEDLAKGLGAVILTPRSANETDIALAAWGRLDTFSLEPDGNVDVKRIEGFVKRWRNKAPEAVPINSRGGKEY